MGDLFLADTGTETGTEKSPFQTEAIAPEVRTVLAFPGGRG